MQAILSRVANYPHMRVHLLTSSPTEEKQIERVSESLTVYRLPVGKRNLFYWRRVEVLRFLRRAQRFVRAGLDRNPKRPPWDMAVGFFGFPSGYVTWRHAKRLPYLIFLRGSDVPGFNPRFGLDYVLLRPLFRRIWRGAEGVIGNSRLLAELASRTCPELDYEILTNGVDTQRFQPDPAVRSEEEPIRLVTAARLIPRKAVGNLLEALHQLGEGISLWELSVLGDGPERRKLEDMANALGLGERVRFHGHVDREAIPAHLASADIFVMPSLWEGMSNAVLEAMASGLPVIVCRTGGTEELVTDNGFVVTPGDTDELAAALGKMIDNPEARLELGRRSRLHAEEMSWEKVAALFIRRCFAAVGQEAPV